MEFTKEERQKLITLVSAEIMKSNFHYGTVHPSTKLLYSIRDKLLKQEEK